MHEEQLHQLEREAKAFYYQQQFSKIKADVKTLDKQVTKWVIDTLIKREKGI